MKIHTSKIDYDDYEMDDFEREIRKERYDNENIRYCDCGKKMNRIAHETEIYGHLILEYKWECDDCD